MSGQSKGIFNRLYNSAEQPEDLPWHETDPPEFLIEAINQRDTPGSALDIGCGAGTYTIYMAECGYQVTAIDFMPQAITMLKQRIVGRDLAIDAQQADIGKWTASHPFDIVLDVGCLHTPGTIDIDNRPAVNNPDGSVSTEHSISIGTHRGEALIPTVVDGKKVTDEEAIQHFFKTDEHLGIFEDAAAATAYAKKLHKRQEKSLSDAEKKRKKK
jgi:SAM-dependent methyltransferase